MILWEKKWKYPETVDIWETNPAQVLMSEVQVRYYGTKEISCEIVDDEIIEKNGHCHYKISLIYLHCHNIPLLDVYTLSFG